MSGISQRQHERAELMLRVTEIFFSIQGESTWTGLPCAFVRLTGCPLRCRYCDTTYAFHEGNDLTISQIVSQVEAFGCRLVEVTGGEPLAQPHCIDLLKELLEAEYVVLLETSGALPVMEVPPAVIKIMDMKCPSSGETHRNLDENVEFLQRHDEVKFVIGSREDYDWAQEAVARYRLIDRCSAVLFSPVLGEIQPRQLAEWILADRLGVRLQLQIHKHIWPPGARGV